MLPVDISEHGKLIDLVIKISVGGGIIVGIISFLIVFYIIARFRRGRNPFPLPDVPAGLKRVILIDYIMIIFDIVLLVASSYAWVFFFVRPIESVKKEVIENGEKFVEVRVIGRQFFWTFWYPGKDGKFDTRDDFKLANLLVVPKDTNVFLDITSGDVLHSFFVPNARLKYDAIPGRWTHIWFKPTEEGEFEIACAELCGAMHYKMKALMRVLQEEEYKRWFDNAPYQ